jgi:alkylation response protein AidB-like acyl-CoA dehydrogenase
MNHGGAARIWRAEEGARRIGLASMDAPKELGGGGCSMLLQAVAQEQTGRVTNALGWRFSNVQRWMTEAWSPHQIETWVKPLIADTRHECYAITEAEAGSDVDAIQATARRDGEHYVLRGEKWHVTSGNLADVIIFQGKLAEGPNAGAHCLFFVDSTTPGIEMVRSLPIAYLRRASPDLSFQDARARRRRHRRGGRRHGLHPTGSLRRLMIGARCCAAAQLIDEATAFAKDRTVFGEKLPTSRRPVCWPTA